MILLNEEIQLIYLDCVNRGYKINFAPFKLSNDIELRRNDTYSTLTIYNINKDDFKSLLSSMGIAVIEF